MADDKILQCTHCHHDYKILRPESVIPGQPFLCDGCTADLRGRDDLNAKLAASRGAELTRIKKALAGLPVADAEPGSLAAQVRALKDTIKAQEQTIRERLQNVGPKLKVFVERSK